MNGPVPRRLPGFECHTQLLRARHLSCLILFTGFCLSVAGTTALAEAAGQNALYRAVTEAIRQNRKGLTCGVLAWEMTEERSHPTQTYPNTTGSFQMWWDNEKVTTRSMRDYVSGSQKSGWIVDRSGEIKAFDGKEFRQIPNVEEPQDMAISKDPEFSVFENWLEHCRFAGPMTHDRYVDYCMEEENLTTDWSVVDEDGRQLIKFSVAEKQGLAASFFYDPSKGSNLVREEQYTEKGERQFVRDITLEQISPGLWFPVATDLTLFNIQDGSKWVNRKLALDLKKSSLNEPEQIPKGIFTIAETPEMEISDYRGGSKINYTRDVAPLSPEIIHHEIKTFMDEQPLDNTQPTQNNPYDANADADPHGSAPNGTLTQQSIAQYTPKKGAFPIALKVTVIVLGIAFIGAGLWRCRRRAPAQ
ncbi:MAG: hypothetical protein JSU94_04530 [Phycisphaerales bacterium]|nr:MAG: hypothetical protein JSU94_04530 [Phycisphaerales bacterium]